MNTAPGALLTARDIRLVTDFFNDSVGTLKRVREVARLRNEMPPAYPAATDKVRKLLVQLWRTFSSPMKRELLKDARR